MKLERTLAERGARYGDFTDHAQIAQDLQDVIRDSGAWLRLTPVQRQALTVIADKIARILSGDPNYADNWHDIQGYARLVEERLPAAPSADNDNSSSPDDGVCLVCGGAGGNHLVPCPLHQVYKCRGTLGG